MAKKRIATKKAPAIKRDSLQRLDDFLNSVAPGFIGKLNTAEMRATHAEGALRLMQSRLVSILTKDQLEFAKISGISPELYALEFIELWKNRMLQDMNLLLVPLSNSNGPISGRFSATKAF